MYIFYIKETVAHFLNNRHLHSAIRNGYIWIDESGQLGIKAMNSIVETKAYSYSCLVEADYEPDTGIVINVSYVVITVTRRNLDDVYNYLLTKRLTYIQEDYSGINNEDSIFL